MQERPVYLDLTKIRLPMSAFSSITHRLSGMYIFFITLPLILYVIDQSLSSRSSFDKLADDIVSISFFSFFLFISISIFWYHILTGVRHLIMDFFHIGESLNGSHYSSIFTLFIWLLTSIVFCGYLFI
ncbi:MAG: succinate dehydrogenase, cytochrome b556 subunit [SAR86 cluster bacterium]|uniref:Succinate dehydrogenase cytochrome b556 subunit n=1 Tax=SAR86 cluster bacterium TaxID=2030880 RepID=A0A520MWL0_9GAMM|nr:succinate dehydrogenase, cytochrome b556 subunit [Gammaproteobacteria bacterium]RZO25569.1 MAG: succinate dehydrogenase, cytochrome b556 subunit [SAR86 cluster bacterium]